jgi:hypothetical protein
MTKKVLDRLVRFVLDLLFPPRCVFCGEIVPPGHRFAAAVRKRLRRPGRSVIWRFRAVTSRFPAPPCIRMKVKSAVLSFGINSTAKGKTRIIMRKALSRW